MVLGVALLGALLVAELAVRLAAPQQLIQIRPDIWQPADSVGWDNRPNVNTTINTGERTVHVYTDAEGFRVGQSGHRDGSPRVLVIGDSFMEALQVEYDQSFPNLLEQSLARRLHRPAVVWNAGVDGWDPPQYLIRARQLLERHQVDLLVVAVYLGNDIVARRVDYVPPRVPQLPHQFRFPRRLAWSAFVDATLYPLNDVLKRHSHLYVLLKNRLRTLRQRAGLTADYFPAELKKSQASSPRWELTAQICAEIAAAARHHGVPTVFALIPTPFAVDSAVFNAFARGFGIDPDSVDVEQPTRLLGAALRAHDLTVIPVLPEFRAAKGRGVALYGMVDRHLTLAGHQELERAVEPAVIAALAAAARADTSAAIRRRTP